MARTVTIVYTVFSILAFIALVSWLASAYFRIKSDNLVTAANTFQEVRSSVAGALGTDGGVDTSGFRSLVHSLFLQDPMIEVLSVTTQSGAVQFVLARQASDLTITRVTDNQWNGAIRYDKATQYLFSGPLPMPEAKTQLTIKTLFSIVRREDLYALARVVLIYLISFVILTGIIILLMPLFGRNAGSSAGREKTSVWPTPDREPDTEASARVAAQQTSDERTDAIAQGFSAVPPPRAQGFKRDQSSPSIHESVEESAATSRRRVHEPPSPRRLSEAEDEVAEPVALDIRASENETPLPAAQSKVDTQGADELPPGVHLPSLEDVSGEEPVNRAAPDEISLFEQLQESPTRGAAIARQPGEDSLRSSESRSAGEAARSGAAAAAETQESGAGESAVEPTLLEVTELEEPSSESAETPTAASDTAAEELADIEDFEDLEEIDGHQSPESHEPRPGRPLRQATTSGPTAENRPETTEPRPSAAQSAGPPKDGDIPLGVEETPSPPPSFERETGRREAGLSAPGDTGSTEETVASLDKEEEPLAPRGEEQTVAAHRLDDVEPIGLTDAEERELTEIDVDDVEPIGLTDDEERELTEIDVEDVEPLALTDEDEREPTETRLEDVEPLALTDEDERELLEPQLDDVEPLALTDEDERELLEPQLDDVELLDLSEESGDPSETDTAHAELRNFAEDEGQFTGTSLDDVEPLALTDEEERELLEPQLDDVELLDLSEVEAELAEAELGLHEAGADAGSAGAGETIDGVPGPSGAERTPAAAASSPDTFEHGSTWRPPGGRDATRELFDPETGLAWEDHLEQRLSFELDRAAAFDQDLSVSIIRFAEQGQGIDRLNYARDIRTSFPFHDLCFEHGRDGFAIVLPNTDIDQAIRAMENFRERLAEDRPGAPRMVIGLSARNGRLLGGERLLKEAEAALLKARQDRKNTIFALRVDPGKYREFIKSTLR